MLQTFLKLYFLQTCPSSIATTRTKSLATHLVGFLYNLHTSMGRVREMRIKDLLIELKLGEDSESQKKLRKDMMELTSAKYHNDAVFARLSEEEIAICATQFLKQSEKTSNILQPAIRSLPRDRVLQLLTEIYRWQKEYKRQAVAKEHKREAVVKEEKPTVYKGKRPSPVTPSDRATKASGYSSNVEDSVADPTDDDSDVAETNDDDDIRDGNYMPEHFDDDNTRNSADRFMNGATRKRLRESDDPVVLKRLRLEQHQPNTVVHTQPASKKDDEEWTKAFKEYLRTCQYNPEDDLLNLRFEPLKELIPLTELSESDPLAPRRALACREVHFCIKHYSQNTKNTVYMFRHTLFAPTSTQPWDTFYDFARKAFTRAAAQDPLMGWHFDILDRNEAKMLEKEHKKSSGQQTPIFSVRSQGSPYGHVPNPFHANKSTNQLSIHARTCIDDPEVPPVRHKGRSTERTDTASISKTTTSIMNPTEELERSPNIETALPGMSQVEKSPEVYSISSSSSVSPANTVEVRSTADAATQVNLSTPSGLPTAAPAPTTSVSPQKLCSDPKHLRFENACHIHATHLKKITALADFWRVRKRELVLEISKAKGTGDARELERLSQSQIETDGCSEALNALADLRPVVIDY